MEKFFILIRKYLILIIAILLIIYGQKLFFLSKYLISIYFTATGFFLFLFWWLGQVKISLKINLHFFSAVISIFSGLLALLLIKQSPSLGLFLFILSGIFLLFSKPADQKLLDFSDIPDKTKPIKLWEITGIIILIIFAFAVRIWNFDSIPPGAAGHEGIVANSYNILKSKYISFIGDGLDWPTLIYYQGIFFADLINKYITSFRIPIVLWGGLAVIAFYFVARRLTSPITALIFSFIFSVQEIFLIFSRMLGTHIVCFIPHILAFGLLVQAIDKNKWWLFFAAGLSAGFGLHAYWPGRTVPFIFLFWFIWLFLFNRKVMPSIKNQLFFWLGFLIVSGPVLYVAITNPDLYWGYIKGIDLNQSKGIMGYLDTLKNRLPVYLKMFHIRSDIYWGFKTAYVPIFDYILQYFFPIGFFIMLFTFWKPVNSFLIAAFCAAMLPGILGGDNLGHPTTNRVIMVYPVASLFAAIAFERMRLALNQKSNKLISIGIVSIGLLLALWSVINGVNNYFNKYMQHPAVITSCDYINYLASKEVRVNKDKQHIITHFMIDENSRGFIFYSDNKFLVPYNYDGFFIMNEHKDYLFTLQGHLEPMSDYMKKLFPNAAVKKYINDKIDHPYYKSGYLQQRPFLDWPDPFNKKVNMISIIVPQKDIIRFHDIIDNETRDTALAFKEDFGSRYAGKIKNFSGAFILDTNYSRLDEEYKANTFTVKFLLDFGNWDLYVDGINVKFNKEIILNRGTHFFTIKGKIPENFTGSLPLKIQAEGENLDETGRIIGKEDLIQNKKVIAIQKPVGMRFYYFENHSYWDGKPLFMKQEISSIKHVNYLKMNCPFSIKGEGVLEVPEDDNYEFSTGPYIYGRIYIDGDEIFNNFSNLKKPEIRKNIYLKKNMKYKLRVDYQFYCEVPVMNVFCIYVKKSNQNDDEILPFDWVAPY